MNKKITYLIFAVMLIIVPLLSRIWDFQWWNWLIIGGFLLIIKKYPRSIWLIAIALFFWNMSINKLFSLQLHPWGYSFDKERTVFYKPEYLNLLRQYWGENLWMPYKIRNIFYRPWLFSFNWLDSSIKLLSPGILTGILGYSGSLLLILGLIDYIKSKKRQWWPVIWFLSVLLSSGLSILVDRKNAFVLAIPALIYFWIKGVKSQYLNKIWVCWVILIVIDLMLILL